MNNTFISNVIFVICCAFAYGLADDNLVAHYTFENGFEDSSGNNLHGIPFGDATTIFDDVRDNYVLRLDGNADYVDLGNNPLFNWTGAFSVAFWINLNEWQVNWDTILKKSDAWSLERDINQSALAFYHWPYFVRTAVPLMNDRKWHHIAATYDGSEQKLYQDGVLFATVQNQGEIAINSNHVYIGFAEGLGRYFNGLLDDIRIYNRILTEEEIDSLGGSDNNFSGEIAHIQELEGNYIVDVEVSESDSTGPFRVFFSSNSNTTIYAYIEISNNIFSVGRQLFGITTTWKVFGEVGPPPWKIKILKKGNFYRFWVNNATGWIRGPLGEWEGIYEPRKANVGTIVPDIGMVQSFKATQLPWLQQITQPIIPRGPADSFYEEQAIPGAILEYQDKYYMYFMAGMKGDEEGSSRRTIGIAVSSNLYDWNVEPEPVLSYEDLGEAGDNLYPGSAVMTPDGKIALLYSVQKFPDWQGFFLATADHPLGPFTNYESNPVYKHFTHAHEFDLIQVEEQECSYILFYAGYTPNPPYGLTGDRGYILYSDDLVTWNEEAQNPVFGPETLDNWDAVHIRPRSLHRIDDTWYLWYEGCNQWSPPGSSYHGWWDTIGLARSEDLLNWKYYPRNPALPALGISAKQFDKNWVGWPRMIIKNDTGYVFYTGDGETGMRTIPIEYLTNWEYEQGGPTTIDERPGKDKLNNAGILQDFILYQNYPNPFNPITSIKFNLHRAGNVTLSIYNTLGQKIYGLASSSLRTGYHKIVWDGTDQNGNQVGSGIYLYELKSENYREVKKLVFIN
jgi:predicted GH43/DUF377 family glycosyl hydrolase